LFLVVVVVILLSDFQSTKTFISQPIAVKLRTKIGDNVLHRVGFSTYVLIK